MKHTIMTQYKKAVIIILLIFKGIESARILAYFPTPSISHQVVFRPIIQELARRGHEVVVVTTDPVFPKGKTPANLTEIDVHDVSYGGWQEFLKMKQGKKDDLWLQMKVMIEKLATIFELQIKDPEVQAIIKKDRKYYDLLLLEACQMPVLGLIHKFDAPAIQISSFGALDYHYEAMGSPIHPILYPTPIRQRLYNLTFYEKVMEYYAHLKYQRLIHKTMKHNNFIVKKIFGEDVPLVEELQNKVKMLFLNEHPIWGDNHPVPPNIISIGGILNRPSKQLPQEIKDYLDSSKNGIIYISFGTNVLPSLLPPEKIKIMTSVLSKLPYDILWKWDKDELPGKSENIKISKWFPQADLLKHPKIKLFITQGGLQSTDEAINAAVPLCGIPIIADQWYNVEKYARHKIGKQLEMEKLTETEFEEAVKSLIEDKSYKNNILRLRSLMREHPVSPLSLSIFWIEHVIKYGGDHLKPQAAHMSWIEYYEVKLILIAMLILLSVLTTFYLISRLAINFFIKRYKLYIRIKSE
ncbi:UDP-glucosyltransferase 2-like [Danaus plexippus]|uniref:UDP-glucosyltransferase 2-like n=1 Tax=Danaus plexippus TaxID=13037 RepID=UPI002AB2575B|nr:UDP-glucosyltransferase 2-like [Danaus plexippus]